MRFQDVFNLLQTYGLLGISVVVCGCAIFLFIYFVVYLRLMKGKNRLSTRRLILWCTLWAYLIIVFGATLISRGGGFYGSSNANFRILSTYRLAWFSFSINEWRNIILNIAMFIPLGILLPMISDKLRQMWKVVGIGFALTVMIECIQLITNRGIFDLGDIFHNTLGMLIGYGLYKAVFAIKDGGWHRAARFIGWLSPLLATVAVFVGIFVVYDLKEFGNMPGTYAYRQDMSGINLSCDALLSDEPGQAMVYASSGIATSSQTKEFAETFFEAQGATLDETRIDIYNDTAVYYAQATSTEEDLCLWVDYRAMSYWYTDFSGFEFEPDDSADETLIRKKLVEFGIDVPEDALFSEMENGMYSFTMPSWNENVQVAGELTCTYYNDGKIKNINNNIIYFQPVRNIGIMSESQAYQQLEAGCFVPPFMQHPSSIKVTSVRLEYKLDTKGYYMPVYAFESDIDGSIDTIMIPTYN